MAAAVEAAGVSAAIREVSAPGEAIYEPGTIDYVEVGALTKTVPYGRISAEGGRTIRPWRQSPAEMMKKPHILFPLE